MAGFTNNFNMAYFDFGDLLNAPINVQRELDRFLFIDKQMYGLYNIFDNGVISGWEVEDPGLSQLSNGISVSISSGKGVVDRRYAETKTPYVLGPLTPDSNNYIYAQILDVEYTSTSNTVFITSTSSNVAGAVKIAHVLVGSSGITSIDNTDKDYVFVEGQIETAVGEHVHRGYPSKIDLTLHTKNRLPGAKVESFDASLVNSGRLDLERVPVLNHNDLLGRGVLTHAQIDTYIQNFSDSSVNIFGEVATANRMLQTLYLKKQYSDLDLYFVNELDFIAGISPTSYYDEISTTATVDTEANTIAGFPFASTTAYFFTKAFELPSNIVKCFISSQQDVVLDGSITFGLNMANSVDFDDYTLLTRNTVNTISSTGQDMRVGIKLVSPSNLYTHDPYATSFLDYVDFDFVNEGSDTHDFHFRVRFYTDEAMTNLYLTKFSESEQDGWIINDSFTIPDTGYPVSPGNEAQVTYYPPDFEEFSAGLTYYIMVDIWDGVSFSTGESGYTFVSSGEDSDDKYANIPRVDGFSIIFELENNQTVRLNV